MERVIEFAFANLNYDNKWSDSDTEKLKQTSFHLNSLRIKTGVYYKKWTKPNQQLEKTILKEERYFFRLLRQLWDLCRGQSKYCKARKKMCRQRNNDLINGDAKLHYQMVSFFMKSLAGN